MKKTTILFAFLIVLTISCDNSTKTTTSDQQSTSDSAMAAMKANIEKLNELLSSIEDPVQKFEISTDKPSTVKGKKGTMIEVDPANLTTESGKPIGKTIQVELKELSNQAELVKSGAQTVSNGKLLVSGGAYYINMTSEGETVKIKEGKSINVTFPKIASEQMDIFYGQKDSIGLMNWEKGSETFASKKPSEKPSKPIDKTIYDEDPIESIIGYISKDSAKMTPEERKTAQAESKSYQVVYEAIQLKQLGWINCDRFLNEPNLTDVLAKVDTKEFGTVALALLFKDINSIRNEYTSQNGSATLTNLPINKSFKLVAYAIKGEKIYTYSENLKVTANQKITMNLKEDNKEGLKNLFNF